MCVLSKSHVNSHKFDLAVIIRGCVPVWCGCPDDVLLLLLLLLLFCLFVCFAQHFTFAKDFIVC